MSSWVMAITYIGGMLLVMSAFSFIWRRRKTATIKYEPWFPEHTTRDIYVSLLQEKSPPPTELQLKSALLRRAMTDVERMLKLGEDRPALVSLVQKGLVGEDLWNSFLKAEQELQQDIMEVTAEADTFKEDWGQTILHTANQMVQHERHKNIREDIRELKEKEEKEFKKREEREKAEEIEQEKRENARLEKERKKAEEELLKMDEAEKKKSNSGKDNKGKGKKKDSSK
ncbi:Sec62/63 complex, subunit Sec66 [Gigaspora margarita]|uniref:Sec62/63 complex, subunit Sec66 n=1 Tax=Gigaspora margarita TaxID=4874 RepID=A0A8H4A583_GIGMA|nr:Sec62/63 complex, subunit Sec66 [Gigaspora margarita]